MILSAEAYRTEIAAIDRLVFEEGPYSGKRGRALGERLEELARRVKAASDSRSLTIESLELRHLASVARDFPPDAPRAPPQNNWMRLRSNLFDEREWFARSAADLIPSEAPTRVPAAKALQAPRGTRAGSHGSSPPARAGGEGG